MALPDFDPRQFAGQPLPAGLLAQYLEHRPQHFNPNLASHVFFHYNDIRELLSSKALGRLLPKKEQLAPWEQLVSEWMLYANPPHHGQLRQDAQDFFKPARVQGCAPAFQRNLQELLAELAKKDSFCLYRDLAYPYALRCILTLLEFPAKDEEQFHRWAQLAVSLVEVSKTSNDIEQANLFAMEFQEYLQQLNLGAGSPLTQAGQYSMLLFAGHDTTAFTLANYLHLALVAKEQAPVGAKETLGRCSSVAYVTRHVLEDCTVAGQQLPRGEHVLCVLAAANIEALAKGKAALQFGSGIHRCLGAGLAQLEVEIFMNELAAVLPRLALDEASCTYAKSLVVQGYNHLPASWT